MIVPGEYQPPLPLDRLIREEPPGPESLDVDVVFVGAGPAGLAGAIELSRLAQSAEDGPHEWQIAVLEKAGSLGEHCLSGAVVNPAPFRELFPELDPSDLPFIAPVHSESVHFLTRRRALPVPVPPTMRNRGNFVASICEIVRWLGERAEALGVHILTGAPAESLLVSGGRVTGVRTAESGLERDGTRGPGYAPPTDVVARVTALAEGSRGALTQAYMEWQRIGSDNPQIYAIGVKELWETPRPPDSVNHTVGWPLGTDTFGGSFMYPMGPNLVALGLVVGLDYPRHSLDAHQLLQEMKTHPFFRRHLEGGELLEWGARTIPEGGYYSLPQRLSGAGVVILGDAAGFVDVPSLKGIHYAMESGIRAARAIDRALIAGDASAEALSAYDRSMAESYVIRDLYERRNMRLAYGSGFWRGTAAAGLATLTRGRVPGDRISVPADAAVPRRVENEADFSADGRLTFGKADAVFRSGNRTRDDVPSHLVVPPRVPPELGEFYQHMCPAGVYEWRDGRLHVNAPNCIDCKATDVLGPRWTPREGGSGPRYRRM